MQLDDGMTSDGPRTIRIKKVNVLQSALTLATLMAILVFFILLLVLIFGGMMGGMMGEALPFAAMGGGVMMLILGPIMYFVIGFIMYLAVFALYNLVTKWTGGIEVSVEP